MVIELVNIALGVDNRNLLHIEKLAVAKLIIEVPAFYKPSSSL